VPAPIFTLSGSAILASNSQDRRASPDCDALEIGGDLAPDIAAVEIVETGIDNCASVAANAVC